MRNEGVEPSPSAWKAEILAIKLIPHLAGIERFELPSTVLETVVLPLN